MYKSCVHGRPHERLRVWPHVQQACTEDVFTEDAFTADRAKREPTGMSGRHLQEETQGRQRRTAPATRTTRQRQIRLDGPQAEE